MNTEYYISPIGTLKITFTESALCGIKITNNTSGISSCCNHYIFKQAVRWLDKYFYGQNPDFTPPIELIGTEFQKKVWNELLKIEFGHSASYGEIARRINCKSAQAIGQAVGKNPLLIIVPCHRILASGRKIGGFSAGIENKIKLLEIEKISFK